MPRRTKEEAEITRKKILKSALETFYEKGYTHSSLEDIALRSELTKGAIYWHFGSKQDLFYSLIVEMDQTVIEGLREFWANVETLEDLRRFYIEMVRFITSDDEMLKYYALVSFKTEWVEELRKAEEYFDKLMKNLEELGKKVFQKQMDEGIIDDTINAMILSRTFIILVDGFVLSFIEYFDACNPVDDFTAIIDTLFRGLSWKSRIPEVLMKN